MTRADEPGWRLAAMNDVSGRRGIWFKFDAESSSLEICAGREGDDCYIKLVANSHLSIEAIQGLRGILDTGAWMVDDAREIGCFRILEIAGRYREQHKKDAAKEGTMKTEVEFEVFDRVFYVDVTYDSDGITMVYNITELDDNGHCGPPNPKLKNYEKVAVLAVAERVFWDNQEAAYERAYERKVDR